MKQLRRIVMLTLALLLAVSPALTACVHNWVSTDTKMAATCTHSGYEQRLCPVCNSVEYKTLNALGHDWGGWSNTKAPACEVPGTNERTCNAAAFKETRWARTEAQLGPLHHPQACFLWRYRPERTRVQYLPCQATDEAQSFHPCLWSLEHYPGAHLHHQRQ